MLKPFNRKEWLEKECVPTGSTLCDMCPFCVYDGETRKCEKDMFDKCQSGELYEDGE